MHAKTRRRKGLRSGHGQYAHVELIISLSAHGSGFKFENKIHGGAIPREYIPTVEKGILEAMQKGILVGFSVIDVTVSLVDGSSHEVDSPDLAFRIAARECFKLAFKKATPVLLKPYMSLDVTTPEEYMGGIVGHICSKRGRVVKVDANNEHRVISASIPLSEMFGYVSTLRNISSGRASYMMRFEKYLPASEEIVDRVKEEHKIEK